MQTASPGRAVFDAEPVVAQVDDEPGSDIVEKDLDAVAAEHDATLGIIGEGPEEDTLKRQARALDSADQVSFLSFLDEYEDVLGHMRAADIFASPSTREGFGITYVEAMAADCTVIAADHPDSAAKEVIDDAGFVVEPAVGSLTKTLDDALRGERPPTNPVERAQRYDWGAAADQAEAVYRCAIDGAQ